MPRFDYDWDRMLDVGNPYNDEEEAVLCEECQQELDEENCCTSPWCSNCNSKWTWEQLAEAYGEVMADRDDLKQKLRFAKNRVDHLKMLLQFPDEMTDKGHYETIAHKLFWVFYEQYQKEDKARGLGDSMRLAFHEAWELSREVLKHEKKA